ncbi:hypothetical protein CBL_03569 [Carabus blaptoides fortunei]
MVGSFPRIVAPSGIKCFLKNIVVFIDTVIGKLRIRFVYDSGTKFRHMNLSTSLEVILVGRQCWYVGGWRCWRCKVEVRLAVIVNEMSVCSVKAGLDLNVSSSVTSTHFPETPVNRCFSVRAGIKL